MRSVRRIVLIVGLAAMVLALSSSLAEAARGSERTGAGARDATGVRHHLFVRYPSLPAGQTEQAAEVVRNDHPFAIDVWVSFVVTFPCGGGLIGDPLSKHVPGNSGVERWQLSIPTPVGCVGTYTITEQVQDRRGSAQDSASFVGTS
jgi:hypothetical protein